MLRRLSLIFATFAFVAAQPDGRDPFPQRIPGPEWLQFDGARRPRSVISDQNVGNLELLWRAALPEGADGAPVYVDRITSKGRLHDLLIASTTRGRIVAIDAAKGNTVWQTEPPDGPRWTTSSPAVDSSHTYVYGYALDGYVHRYSLRTGEEVIGPGWPALITLKGEVEKGSSNISIATAASGRSYVYMTIAAYPEPGDDGDYQGHLVTIDLVTGEQHVFNALCSDRDAHFTARGDDSDCSALQAGIWARAGAVYDIATDRLFVTTGNGPYTASSGGFHWGTSVVALRPDGTTDAGTPLDSYTPEDFQKLTDEDRDLSSTTIEPLPSLHPNWPRLGVQSGKDGRLRLLNLEDLSGQGAPRHLGGELQLIDLPRGGEVLTQPAAWRDPARNTWLFVTNHRGTIAYQLVADEDDQPKLTEMWESDATGTTPVVVNGIIYLAAPHHFVALRATTGEMLWHDDTIGDIHWQSPIVIDDTVYIEDNSGYISAYSMMSTSR
jgi:outer membrane protein assembly factor BamB